MKLILSAILPALLVQPATAFENINPPDIHYYEFPEGCRSFFPNLQQKISEFGAWGILLAGLIDGINPCAFAVIIFLTSMLGPGFRRLILLSERHPALTKPLLAGVLFALAGFWRWGGGSA